MGEIEQEEAWESTAAGRIWLTLPDGREKVTKPVHGGRTFYVLPSDRRRFSTEVADAQDDPFRNGTFRFVGDLEVFGTERERAELASSPNALTPDQMVELAKAPPADFDARLAAMTNPIAVAALRSAAESVGAPEARTAAIDARLVALRPVTAQEGDPELDDGPDPDARRVGPARRPGRAGASVGD